MNRLLIVTVVVTLAFGLGVSRSAGAVERFTWVLDPDSSALMGARDVGSAVRMVDYAAEASFGSVHSGIEPVQIGLRLVRTIFVDGPAAMLAIWVQHEVFGHAARGRELGLRPTFHIAVPPPYGFDVGSNRTHWSELRAAQLPRDARVALTSEGQEAEKLLVRDLVSEALLAGRWGRVAATVLFIRVAGELRRLTGGSGDWNEYRWRVRGIGFAQQWAPILGWALDPLAWWVLYDYVWSWLVRGRAPGRVFTFPIGRFALLPRPVVRQSPWGQQLGIDAFVLGGGDLYELELLVGPQDSGAPTFALSGAATMRELLPNVDLGLRVGLWTQPELMGGGLEVDGTLRLAGSFGLFVMAGIKSIGYLPGRPLDAGFYGQLGVVLSP